MVYHLHWTVPLRLNSQPERISSDSILNLDPRTYVCYQKRILLNILAVRNKLPLMTGAYTCGVAFLLSRDPRKDLQPLVDGPLGSLRVFCERQLRHPQL